MPFPSVSSSRPSAPAMQVPVAAQPRGVPGAVVSSVAQAEGRVLLAGTCPSQHLSQAAGSTLGGERTPRKVSDCAAAGLSSC